MTLLDNRSSYNIFYGCVPDYEDIHHFGCICYVHVDKSLRDKFVDKAVQYKFIGYVDYKGYRCYNPHIHKIYVSRNAVLMN